MQYKQLINYDQCVDSLIVYIYSLTYTILCGICTVSIMVKYCTSCFNLVAILTFVHYTHELLLKGEYMNHVLFWTLVQVYVNNIIRNSVYHLISMTLYNKKYIFCFLKCI